MLALRRLPRPLPGLFARNLWLVLVFWTAVNAWSGQWLPAAIGLVTLVVLAPRYGQDHERGDRHRGRHRRSGERGPAGQAGYDVTVLEKNPLVGGRANYFEADGFRFDMGPSWYLMPDVFEHFFALLGERVEDHLELTRLDPSYRIAFRGTDRSRRHVLRPEPGRARPSSGWSPGSGQALRDYLERAEAQYGIAIDQFMYRNHDNGLLDFFDRKTAMLGRQLHVFENMHSVHQPVVPTDAVQKILEYQLVFLGSSPYNTPALYNIMSHIDFNMGVFYPQGGIYSIIRALEAIGESVRGQVPDRGAGGGDPDRGRPGHRGPTRRRARSCGPIWSSPTPTCTTPRPSCCRQSARSHSKRSWQQKTLAPSAFILYLGLKGRLPSLTHHNLAFGQDWRRNFTEIFDRPVWPDDPSYYVCAPSRTDPAHGARGPREPVRAGARGARVCP